MPPENTHLRKHAALTLFFPICLIAILWWLSTAGNRRTENHSQAASAPTASQQESDPWTRSLLAAYTVPAGNEIESDAPAAFRTWLSGNRSDTLEGARLARQRLAFLESLVRKDPEAAWREMIPATERDGIPPAILTHLETPVDTTGSWESFMVCGDPSFPRALYHEATLNGADKPIFALPVGNMTRAGKETNIRLIGYTLPGIALFDGQPPRKLEWRDLPPAGYPLRFTDPLSGHSVDPTLDNGRLGPSDVAWFDGTRTTFFENEETYARWAASPADDETSAEAPLESTSGQMDSLPFTIRPKNNTNTGWRTLIYMRTRFNGWQNSQTEAAAYSQWRQVNDKLMVNSKGRYQILPTITPVIDMQTHAATYGHSPDIATYSTPGALRTAVKDVAERHYGYDVASYGHQVIYWQNGPGDFGGLASLPGKDLSLKTTSVGTTYHELGHNMYFPHAGFLKQRQQQDNYSSSIEIGTHQEYGSPFDQMGYYQTTGNASFTDAFFNASSTLRNNWIRTNEQKTVDESGTVRITPYDAPTWSQENQHALRIRKQDGKDYFISLYSVIAKSPSPDSHRNGARLEIIGAESGFKSTLIDATYWSTNERQDANIPLGFTFQDPEEAIFITPLARAADRSWMDVHVHRGHDPSNRPPVISSFTASTTTPGTNGVVNFNITASDPDGHPLAYHWYFDDANWHRNLNTSSASFSWSSASWRSVICTVTDMRGGIAVANLLIQVGNPTSTHITGQVIDRFGHPVRGVPVDNGLPMTDGTNLISGHSSTLTDNNGRYYLTGITNGSWSPACRAFGNTAGRNNGSNPVTVSANTPLGGVDFLLRNVELVALTPTVAESGTATIRLQRSSTFTAAITVPVISIGKAVLGTDFTLNPAPTDGTYTLPLNVSSLDITVTATSDSATEGPEDITLALEVSSNHSMVRRIDTGGGNFVSMPGPVRTSLTLTDAQSTLPRVRLAAVSPLLPENGTATVRATRFGDLSQPLLIKMNAPGGTAVSGTDYQILGGSNSGRNQTIPAGQATLDIVLQGITDSLTEGRESISLALTNNDPAFLRDSQNTANLGIADTEITVLTVSAPTSFAAENTSQNGIVRVTRSGATTNPLTVEYNALGTALHGTDYAALPGTLTIPAGQSSADIIIDGLPDSFADDGETVVIHLASSDEFYRLANPSATVTIGTSTVVNTLAWTGTTSGAWNDSIPANWNNTTPVFGNTANVVFDGANPISTYGTWLGDGNRTVRSIRFSNFTTPLEIRINNNSSTARTLIFAANSGNATITMDSTVTAPVTIGALAGTNNNGTSRLDSNLDVFQDSDSLLTIRRPLNESGGSWGVNKYGTGTLLLAGDNNYSGNVEVDEGTLRISNNGALGNGPKNVIVSAGATLEFEGNVNPGTGYAVTLNGSGVDGLGALYRTSGVDDTASTFSDGIALVGPTTVGSASGARFGVGGATGTGTTAGLHTLTKGGAGQFDLRGTINIGNVLVAQGIFQTRASSWNNGYSIAVAENAELQLFDITNPLPRPIQLVNASINSTGSVNITGDTLTGPITLEGTCTIRSSGDPADRLILSGPVSSTDPAATLNITGDRRVVIASSSPFSGPIHIDQGATLEVSGSIAGNITFANNTATLTGSGSVNASVTTSPATTLAPQGLAVSGNLDLAPLAGGSGRIAMTLGNSAPHLTVGTLTTLGTDLLGASDFTFTGTATGIHPLIRSLGGFTGSLDPADRTIQLQPGLPATLAIHGDTLVLVTGAANPYEAWVMGFGLSGIDATFGNDHDRDGTPNGLEWILGGNPTASEIIPLITSTTDPLTGITLNFQRVRESIGLATLTVEYGSTLSTWPGSAPIGPSSSGPDTNGVMITIDTTHSLDEVTALIPTSQTAGGKLFARLRATLP